MRTGQLECVEDLASYDEHLKDYAALPFVGPALDTHAPVADATLAGQLWVKGEPHVRLYATIANTFAALKALRSEQKQARVTFVHDRLSGNKLFADEVWHVRQEDGLAAFLLKPAAVAWAKAKGGAVVDCANEERARSRCCLTWAWRASPIIIRTNSRAECSSASLARVLIKQPRVLLMDEPFAALDAQNRLHKKETLLALWQELRMTVLFVTHDVDEAVFMSDRILVLSERPATLRADLRVELPRPRSAEVLTSDAYVSVRREALSLLLAERAQA